MARTRLTKMRWILAVLPDLRVPEGQVLGIEGAFGDHRLIPDHFPMDAVGRLVDVESLLPQWTAPGDPLVPRFRGRVGVAVLEGDETMGADPVQYDVVLLRSLVLNNPQIGLGPIDPVPALGVTGHLRMGGFLGRYIPVRPPVVHAVEVAVLEDGVIGAGVAFPGLSRHQDHFLRLGPMLLKAGIARDLPDHMPVHEQFPPRADVDDTGDGSRQRESHDGEQGADLVHIGFSSVSLL